MKNAAIAVQVKAAEALVNPAVTLVEYATTPMSISSREAIKPLSHAGIDIHLLGEQRFAIGKRVMLVKCLAKESQRVA